MDIFVRNIPEAATNKQIRNFFHGPLAEYGIVDDYHTEKMGSKPLAILTILDVAKAHQFLLAYGVPPNAPRHMCAMKTLVWDGRCVLCNISNRAPDYYSVQSLAHEASQRAQKATLGVAIPNSSGQKAKISRFAISGVKCGVWDYSGTQLVFTQHWASHKQGTVSFGRKGAVIIMTGSDGIQSRIDLDYHSCHNIVVSGSYHDPSVSFTLRYPPRFYEVSGYDVLATALLSLTLNSNTGKSKISKARLPSIDKEHSKVAGTCFVYRLVLSQSTTLSGVRNLLERNAKSASRITMSTTEMHPPHSLAQSFTLLNHDLSDTARYRGKFSFPLLYQVDRLARNGVLAPSHVRLLLPKIAQLRSEYGLDAILSALGRFYRQVPYAGPDTQSHELSIKALEKALHDLAAAYDQYKHNPENPYEIVKRHQHINLIHKIVITPAATYLDGVEPEPTNRVLRRYADHSDHFMRVVFLDEDRGAMRYDSRASQDMIFHGRFKEVLDTNVLIAGEAYSFLGFSHSSLRSQSCWFMAPIFLQGSLRLPEHILRELGDFSRIRVPAKCAARIGQNFTDTNATVELREKEVFELPIVIRNGYDFSDGVGTISMELLREVWSVYGTRRALKPTALQIRFQGYKGMVSLDSRLQGRKLLLRSNMKKFESAGTWNLEICGAGFKPLPLILNRQLIKILEDLGVEDPVLLDLQQRAVDRLRYVTTTNAVNAASFLDEVDSPKATRMPSLIRLMNQIGLDYRQDQFLYGVVEMAVVNSLRDIKYRGRIPVCAGHTLYGIMDETGFLRAGEVYVVTESSPDGGRKILVKNRIAISRSPALHPGDVQIVNAVDVPKGSPLQRLSNVVVFSQHGERDLPSQLSGGDLDGDQFHIIFHEGLVPTQTYVAAEYPRVSAVELDRPVTRKDMSDFFVKFMESDQLGVICNNHLQRADQSTQGTLDLDCIQLAQMASTAVDFSKTGVPVDMKMAPRYNRYRPDFMAPSPRVIISEKGGLDLEEDDFEDDPAFEDLDDERKPTRYYRSVKVLGKLYRAIDEQHFLSKMQSDRQALVTGGGADPLNTLLHYIKREAAKYGILFTHQVSLAEDIRAGYEESLFDILYNYAPTASMPVSEHEAFAGTILGRKGGAQNKPLRELGRAMRERFQAVVDYTIMRMVKGDEQMHGVGDLDMLYDDSLDREVEALPRAIACLQVAVEQSGIVDRYLGELQSFKYIAAGVCLREYERYRLTTLGSCALPPV